MGTILYSGDIRFKREMIEENEILYPSYKRSLIGGEKLEKCSIHIDELILDNTFCDEMFKFPAQDNIFPMFKEII